MKRLLALWLMLSAGFTQAAPFSVGQVLTAQALNTAFSNAQITSGTIDGAVIGGVLPAAGTFSSMYGTTPDAGGYEVTLNSYSLTDVPNAAMAFKSARGTQAAPTALQSGDLLGNMDFFGYNTAFAYAAALDVAAAGAFTGTSMPTQFVFSTTAVNSVVPAAAMTVSSVGTAITGSLSTTGAATLPTAITTNQRTSSAGRAVNATAALAAVTLTAGVSSTYIATPAAAITVTNAAPTADGELRRVCFGAATTVTWAVTAPATASAGLMTAVPANTCVGMVYNSVAGAPAGSAATTWYAY